jgi:hypothetical protein
MQIERTQRMRFDQLGAVDLGDGLHLQHGRLQEEGGNAGDGLAADVE